MTATGGENASGIGCGRDGKCGNITITDGVTSVTANRWSGSPYSIGLAQEIDGSTSSCGTVTIGGTQYYDGTNFLNDGDTYLATNPFTWPTP